MRGVWTVEQVTAAEDRLLARTPDGALMRKAAFGVALAAARTGARHVVLLVGAGNNGGDALWAGAFLRRRGVRVTAVLLAPDRAHPAGLTALRRAGGRVVGVDDAPIEQADLVIDGIVGLQARGGLRPDAAALVDRVASPILAVDLPSGVDPDTGVVHEPAVRADLTVTFGCLKPVHVLADCGRVELVDIGLGPELPAPSLRVLEAADVLAAWRFPGPKDDKYTQGVTGVAAGSSTYPGAAVLATSAAVLATSGMVRYAGSAADEVRGVWPEVVATGSVEDAGRVQAWVVGPGLGTGSSSVEVLRRLLGEGVPLCVDADGITMLAQHPDLWDARDPETPVVITPHDREFARIAGHEVGDDRVAATRGLAKRLNAVVLLKGNTTVIADPDGRVIVNKASSSWAATAGSGDVLSGIIGAVLAGGADPATAAGAAAWLHDRAATLAADGVPTSASRIAAAIPDALRAIR
ncbi:NAD(P)H-hydrate dehydratase [Labedaea rhizosphaerae]|uniref:Bifunctional NAD(P)H-hydrate repair enzyme n=1 Tax=Labedaea rhizosphaerae TaxID=598644 RepID=A0A4R6SP76_LABRH|nr:NAD(P)H-hydrate dehydratase [Labedaea rhizosphaerae]TDQ05794.1 hydroxyethylthiazole kinase-like uncharacterized protein yjeF/hydroxyethylthiazole kinase-like uncharacterized protein yjeF [Labedaea rhizosphaerae]